MSESITQGSEADKIELLRRWISECDQGSMAFFGGAGVSTESGIPDFRSADGLYNSDSGLGYAPEEIISHSFFYEHPKEFFDYYCAHMIATEARPNAAHRKLAELEREGVCRAVITQNIDGLHQAAGSHDVIELHGSVHRNYCLACGASFDLSGFLAARDSASDGIPRCHCGGIIKPDVVLYEEPLDGSDLERAVEAIVAAGLLVIAGTSLTVYPAAGMLAYFRGSHLAIVNRDPTPADHNADLCIRGSIGEALSF